MAESKNVVPTVKSSTGGLSQSSEPLVRLSNHIQMYSSRELTYLSDIRRAFEGVLRAITPFMNGSIFLQGLPSVAFDWALLWGAFPGHHIHRRPGLPSWGWMGHIGRIVMARQSSSGRTQKWLREKTWIDWNYVGDKTVKPVWQSLSASGFSSHERHLTEEKINAKKRSTRDPVQTAAEYSSESCPEYGIGTASNLYGREGRYMPDLEFLQPPYQGTSRMQSMPHDGLEFMTFSCRFYLSQPIAPNAREVYTSNCFVLRDVRGETCGICHDDHNLFGSGWAFEGLSCEVILLSYTTGQSRDRGVYRFAHLGIPEKYRSRGPEGDTDDDIIVLDNEGDMQWDSWDMFNVMLIRPYPQNRYVYERIGIGVLHERAIKNSLEPVCYKSIILC